MKLKNIKYSLVASGLLFIVLSCSKDFLTIEPKGVSLENNYYQNQDQAYAGLIAVYDVLSKQVRGLENMICMLNAGSDDFNAAGGGATDLIGIHSFSDYSISQSTIPHSFWKDFYQGIFRANVLLQKLPAIPMDEAKKTRFTAETKALRAYYYFELVRTFRHIPLILEPIKTADFFNIVQATPEAVYAQIEKDLKESLPGLPVIITNMADEAGRLSQGAAKALLGKVYLYEGKNTLAAAQFADVNGTPGGTSMYGYKLVSNYADLWKINNKFNSEAIIEISCTDKSNADLSSWTGGKDEGNAVCLMIGPRGYTRSVNSTAPDYASGWSFNTVKQDLYDVLKGDPRFDATILDMKALKSANQANWTPNYDDTGYFLKKFLPLNSDMSAGGGIPILNYKQDVYAIRLADTYLMEAEALGATGTRAQALLDAVRARVGLASVPVSMDAIMLERRKELAGEGHRWFDLVRTGRATTALASKGFVSGKNEIWPIPFKELENTKIVQNPNYNN